MCTLIGYKLLGTNQEIELGVVGDSSLKRSTHCAMVVKKANFILEIIRKGTKNRSANII